MNSRLWTGKLLRIAAFLLCQLLLVGKVQALLAVGADAPDFAAEAVRAGKPFTFHLDDVLVNGPVVLYFYPKAFTSGCTVQAHLFSQAMDDFSVLGATVLGISHDDLETQKQFSLKECSEKLPVLADADGKIITAYDAGMFFGHGVSKRVTYVITPDRKIASVYSDMSPDGHVKQALDAIRRWRSAHP